MAALFENMAPLVLTNLVASAIISFVQLFCESGGTGRRARLRGVWFYRTGSSPVSRTKLPANGVIYYFAWQTKENHWFSPLLLRDCVMVARQTLTLFVWVQILVPQPYKDVTFETISGGKNPCFRGFCCIETNFNLYITTLY